MPRALLALILFLSAAPASAQVPYPDGWPKLKMPADGTCVTLSGRYEYRGEPGQKENQFPTINFDNSGFNRMSVRGRPTSASVVHEAGLLRVTIEGDDISPAERANFTREVKCIKGFATRVQEARDFGNARIGHVNYSKTEDRYALAEDGSFVVHRMSQLEMRSGEKRWGEWWFRFKPQQSADAK